jgi:hypothetical protein
MALVPNYLPTDWVQGVTPVDETRMDNIDTNLDAHADAINTLDTRLVAEEAQPDIPTVVNGQWIKGSGGAMVWSAIAQADVTGLVAALAAKEATANKGVVSGYASLDGTGKVPSSQLPAAAASTTLTYQGDWAGATTYQDGDVIVYNGVAYLCVGGPTTTTPDGSVWGAAQLDPIGYAATLPASPVDGQRSILVDSTSNPTYQWLFRYNAGSSSAYKWECLGASPAYQRIDTQETGAAGQTGVWQDVTTVGPKFVLPRAGDYEFGWGAAMWSGNAAQSCFAGIGVAAWTTPLANAPGNQTGTTAVAPGVCTGHAILTGLTATAEIRVRYQGNYGADTLRALYRWLTVRPVRVS